MRFTDFCRSYHQPRSQRLLGIRRGGGLAPGARERDLRVVNQPRTPREVDTSVSYLLWQVVSDEIRITHYHIFTEKCVLVSTKWLEIEQTFPISHIAFHFQSVTSQTH